MRHFNEHPEDRPLLATPEGVDLINEILAAARATPDLQPGPHDPRIHGEAEGVEVPGEGVAHPHGSPCTRMVPRAPAWFPTNVARNSPPSYSNFEIGSLQFQHFPGISKTDRGKLRATFRGGTIALADEAGTPQANTRIVVAREPPATTPRHTGGGSQTGTPTPSTHASGQPGVNDRTSDQASHVGR